MKCPVCKKTLKYGTGWVCDICGDEHHPVVCAGEYSEGSGEYPDEEAYSICKKCCAKKKK